MTLTLFLTLCDEESAGSRASEVALSRMAEVAPRVTGLQQARIFTPGAQAGDPFLAHEAAPPLLLELCFEDIAALESACAADGTLQGLAGLPFTQQAMLARRHPVPLQAPGSESPAAAYVVGYEGPAQDLNAWLAHYIAHHPPLMARLPGIREIEVCTRLDSTSALPFPREAWMLRNLVAFDSPTALSEALRSSARQAMREDYGRLPPYQGRVFHYPMATRLLIPL